ncbi:hypothetical protein L7F22_061173 [Adiantum nelumboides]|nr:hypothetical protein [Adiantum nelumboides]
MERLLLRSYFDRMFKSRLRLSREMFELLTARIAPQLQRSNTNYCKAISIEKRVCVALHRFASGLNLQVIADLYEISTSSAQKIVIDFSDAMLSSGLHDLYIKWPTPERIQSLASGFEAIQGILYVIGAVDGSHIPIIAPRAHHEDYFNRKGFHSIILQMTVTSNCVIWDYDIGWARSLHDWNVFQRSELGQRLVCELLSDLPMLTRVVGGTEDNWVKKPTGGTGIVDFGALFNRAINTQQVSAVVQDHHDKHGSPALHKLVTEELNVPFVNADGKPSPPLRVFQVLVYHSQRKHQTILLLKLHSKALDRCSGRFIDQEFLGKLNLTVFASFPPNAIVLCALFPARRDEDGTS